VLKTLRTVGLLTLVVMFATCAVAFAAAKTKISIDDKGDGFGGYVHSSKYKCENNRKVRLYKITGSRPHPSSDTRIGSDTAQPNGPDSQYFIHTDTVDNANSGRFYVYAKAKRGCKSGRSRVLTR
jgi:hypothetical protein